MFKATELQVCVSRLMMPAVQGLAQHCLAASLACQAIVGLADLAY